MADHTRAFAGILLVLHLAACDGTSPATPVPPDPLFLNSASQDRALFLTWNTAHNSIRMALHCRREGTEQWRHVVVDDRGHQLLDGLENDVLHECYADRELETGERITSSTVAQIPHERQVDYGPIFYRSQAAAGAALKARGIDPRSLRWRGQPVASWGPDAPDGVYTASADPSFVMVLLRSHDDTFRPPLAVRSPDEVRTVLKHALWPEANPFDDPAQFPMPITPIAPPNVGRVRGFASANSFAIAYHPQLLSRCTRFVPLEPTPGKFAIYMDGHQGQTVRHGAWTIQRLLQRGWQVIAVDMPLTGTNFPDRSATLHGHNAFASLQTDRFAPVSLFVQPLKALVDRIEDEVGSDATVMLIGKSGGGWTSLLYGAVDPRIDYVVSAAGAMPLSQRLRERPIKVGDYEQWDPQIFEVVPYEDIMTTAGSRGAFYVYNEHDPCCFRLHPDEPFIRFLREASVTLGKPIGVYVDTVNRRHWFSDTAFAELDTFLARTETATR